MTRVPNSLSPREFRATVSTIEKAVRASDAIILKHFTRARIHHKADGSEVTVADKGAERSLRRSLGKAWPKDPVLGEEFGGSLARSGRCWLVDPIDGTASYVLGIPMFGTLISLLIDGEPVFGCIHLSALKETTFAARGHGCFQTRAGRRARRVHVSAARPLNEAQVGLTSFKESDLSAKGGPWRLSRVGPELRRLRLVGDCVQYALVCRGALDGAIDPLMNPWDIGPLAVCVLEAGGSVSDLNGEQTRIVERRSFVAANTATLREGLCALIGNPAASISLPP